MSTSTKKKSVCSECGRVKPKKKTCRKLAPFICPDCGREGNCGIDHWDMPGGWCCICGVQNCRKTVAQHRKRCKRVVGHRGKCKS